MKLGIGTCIATLLVGLGGAGAENLVTAFSDTAPTTTRQTQCQRDLEEVIDLSPAEAQESATQLCEARKQTHAARKAFAAALARLRRTARARPPTVRRAIALANRTVDRCSDFLESVSYPHNIALVFQPEEHQQTCYAAGIALVGSLTARLATPATPNAVPPHAPDRVLIARDATPPSASPCASPLCSEQANHVAERATFNGYLAEVDDSYGDSSKFDMPATMKAANGIVDLCLDFRAALPNGASADDREAAFTDCYRLASPILASKL